MTAILYPVAPNAEAALTSPQGRAARERDAAALAGGTVVFATETVGPGFPTLDAALAAHAGRVDDDRPGRGAQLAPEDRYCAIVARFEGAAPAPAEPAFASGRRWPKPPERPPATQFRLVVSYWRIRAEGEAQDLDAQGLDAQDLDAQGLDAQGLDAQARALRRKAESAALSAAELRSLARQPLKPVRPQQPLDVGLFEAPAPEAPHILIPDE